MIERAVSIPNRLGLHARAAARFVRAAGEYDADVWIRCGDRKVNGKSLLGVLTLAAAQGTDLCILADGPDEEAAAERLASLVAGGFEEAS